MSASLQRSLRYFRASAWKRFRGVGKECPSCGSQNSELVQRKWFVTSLQRCRECQLLFRTPTTTAEENKSFYQVDYQQGFTTEMPSDADLDRLKASRFAGTEKNYDEYVAVLVALGVKAGGRVFDFGCSWGYGSYQLAQAGFDVDAFEISRPRAEYARSKLGVRIRAIDEARLGEYDAFFSAHVIEHVPSVEEMIQTGMRYLRPGGLFVALTPNGSFTYRSANERGWRQLWGLVHPQLIDDRYLVHRFAKSPLLVTSCPHPVKEIAEWNRIETPAILGLNGYELMFATPRLA